MGHGWSPRENIKRKLIEKKLKSVIIYIEKQSSIRWLALAELKKLHPSAAKLRDGPSFYGKNYEHINSTTLNTIAYVLL